MKITRLLLLLLLPLLFLYCSSDKNSTDSQLSIVYIGSAIDDLDDMNNIILKQYLGDLENIYDLKIKFTSKKISDYKKDTLVDVFNSDVDLIIDNRNGEQFAKSQKLIEDSNIPVIALNADRNDRKYNDATCFLGSADTNPEFIAAYVKKVLKKDSVRFISEYNYPLHKKYLEQFDLNGIKVIQMDTMLHKNVNKISSTDSTDFYTDFYKNAELIQNRSEIPIVLNSHRTWGVSILKNLNKTKNDFTIILPEHTISSLKNDEIYPADNSSLIVLTTPSNATPRRAAIDLLRFRSKNSAKFKRVNAHFFIKQSLIVKDILDEIINTNLEDIKGLDTSKKRDLIFKKLTQLKGGNLQTDNLIYSFTENLEIDREFVFTKFDKDGFFTLPIQIGKSLKPIFTISLGLQIDDVYNIDVKKGTFNADFKYWVRSDSTLISEGDNVQIKDLRYHESYIDLLSEEYVNNDIFRLYKVLGKFNANFDYKEYPFDTQEINISLETINLQQNAVVSIDERGYKSEEELLTRFDIDTWEKTGRFMSVDNNVKVNLGISKGLEDSRFYSSKQLAFSLFIERVFLTPFLTLILPLLVIGFSAIAVMFVYDRTFKIVGVISGSLLIAIITFSITLNQISPASGIIMKLDLIYLLTLCVVALNFLLVVLKGSRSEDVIKRKKHKNKYFVNAFRIVVLSAYTILNIILIF